MNGSDYKLFFTYQPFWTPDILKNESILTDENNVTIAKIAQYQYAGDLFCVPGIGVSGVVFPYGPDREKKAYCYGPVQQQEWQPLYGVEYAFTIRFLPGMFGRYFHSSGSEIPSSGVPLTRLFPELGPYIRMAGMAETLEEFRVVIRKMLSALTVRRRRYCASAEMTWQLSAELLRRRGNMSIQELADYTGFCRRHLQDIFLNYAGVSPKQFCIQIRFQSVLQDMVAGGWQNNLTELSMRNGYFDHSHFNREFKRFTGMCPSDFIEWKQTERLEMMAGRTFKGKDENKG